MVGSFFAFITLGLICPKFCPKDHNHFGFLGQFSMGNVRDSIACNDLCCNPAVLKTSKNIQFWTQIAQKRGLLVQKYVAKSDQKPFFYQKSYVLADFRVFSIMCFG